ncbi:helix-turn-helix domain-containing protein [Stieleria sp. TO1_6]|uniref:helix-turn-helix domain-containing protein n=1 Tax=Stieleria tagensis TaxID=2956795 RepID=UPI00209AA9D2|nr:helix-turn-helix domain-containing protein [Stieleria tagensis]MCO8124162.1 helix-turn-helix domain-containing protein [Stieleria tagensis]
MIGLTPCPVRPAWVNGYELDDTHIQFYAEGSTLDYRSSPASPWYALQFRREQLQRHALMQSSQELRLPLRGTTNLRVPKPSVNSLRAVAASILQIAATLCPSELVAVASRLERQLFESVDAVLRLATESEGQQVWCDCGERSLVRCIETQLTERLKEPFRMATLCARTGMSQRSIERKVKKVYGISPRRLFLVTQMNQIRKELLAMEHGESTVEQVAHKWGVTSLGRFAGRYRNLFGERPFETLIRN